MLKALGLCLVAAGAAGTGLSVCAERGQRVRQLARLSGLFTEIAGEIAYSRADLSEILTALGEKMRDAGDAGLGTALEEIGAGLETGGELCALWQEKMGDYAARGALRGRERKLLLSFPGSVSFPDTERQRTAVEFFAAELNREMEAARAREAEENRMTMAVCLAGGALAGLLLL